MKTTKSQFRIVHYDDYHEISPPKGWRAIELGCFPPVEYQYNRYFAYFALYYKGRRPSLEKIMKRLVKLVSLEEKVHCITGCELTTSREDVEYEVRKSLGLKC